MSASVGGIHAQQGAYNGVFQQQRQRQEDAADASQALGHDLVGEAAPFPVDTTPGPEPFVVFA